MTKLVGLRAKADGYLIDDGSQEQKSKRLKNCIIKRKHKFKNYKNCVKETQFDNKINYLAKNKIYIDYMNFKSLHRLN